MEIERKVCADGQLWDEDDFMRLADRLHVSAPDLIWDDGIITSLGYNNALNRYSVVVLFENESWTEVNCEIDFVGGTRFPFDVQQYKVFVPNDTRIGGFDKHENFKFA